jgi:hypothetical protein
MQLNDDPDKTNMYVMAYNWLLTEMRQSTFRGLWYLLTVWGQKPE